MVVSAHAAQNTDATPSSSQNPVAIAGRNLTIPWHLRWEFTYAPGALTHEDFGIIIGDFDTASMSIQIDDTNIGATPREIPLEVQGPDGATVFGEPFTTATGVLEIVTVDFDGNTYRIRHNGDPVGFETASDDTPIVVPVVIIYSAQPNSPAIFRHNRLVFTQVN